MELSGAYRLGGGEDVFIQHFCVFIGVGVGEIHNLSPPGGLLFSFSVVIWQRTWGLGSKGSRGRK